jgi:hypothetical protein
LPVAKPSVSGGSIHGTIWIPSTFAICSHGARQRDVTRGCRQPSSSPRVLAVTCPANRSHDRRPTGIESHTSFERRRWLTW